MEHFISLLLLPLVSAYNEILEIDQESSGFYGQHLVVALTNTVSFCQCNVVYIVI